MVIVFISQTGNSTLSPLFAFFLKLPPSLDCALLDLPRDWKGMTRWQIAMRSSPAETLHKSGRAAGVFEPSVPFVTSHSFPKSVLGHTFR